jgi:hypothetical protein
MYGLGINQTVIHGVILLNNPCALQTTVSVTVWKHWLVLQMANPTDVSSLPSAGTKGTMEKLWESLK